MNVVLAIDIILALLGLVIVIRHTAIGFIRSVFAFAKLGLCVGLAYWLTPHIFPGTLNNATVLLGYLLVFLGTYISVTFIAYLVDRIFSLPILNMANKFGGFVFGLICAYVVLSVAATLITIISIYTEGDLLGMSQAELVSQSFVYRFFEQFGVFNFVSIKIQLY